MVNGELLRPALKTVTNSIRQYREGQLDIEGLQQNIAAVSSALEGDVPEEIRTIICEAESSIDLIRFTIDSNGEAAALEEVFRRIEDAMPKHQSDSK